MTVSTDVLRFLRDTEAFARDANPSATSVHDAALSAIVEPAIDAAGDNALRPAQVRAFEGLRQLRAGLVLGPPGTGKTHLLSWLVLGHLWARARANLHSRVFLTAFTRSAIETLLGAIAKRSAAGPGEPTLVYLGTPRTRLPHNVRCLSSVHRDSDELRDLLQEPNVVFAATIWGLNSSIEKGCLPEQDGPTAPFFDLVAIDEASQMVLGQGLMALAGMAPACRVVVAGDDRQLPPIRSARGMSIDGREVGGSLYAFIKAGGVPEFALDETFRLNEPLTIFPEKRFYSGIYRSAVPERRLSLAPDWATGLDELERHVLDPLLPTVVLVHDGPSAATHSPFEVELAVRLAARFRLRLRTSAGGLYDPGQFWQESLALVSPHRAQNAAMRARLDSADRSEAFVDTIDRIQGRERDVIIMTYTVSDPEFALAEAEFIFSPERLNVAITRARSKLVVIVSRRMLEVIPPQQEVLDKAEVLREFAFAAPIFGEHVVDVAGLPATRVTVRAQGFACEDRAPTAGAGDPSDMGGSAVPLDPEAQELLETLRRLASGSEHGNVRLTELRKAISHPFGLPGTYADVRRLHVAGWASLEEKASAHGHFWTAAPREHRRAICTLEDADLRDRLRHAVYRDNILYREVRKAFAWMSLGWPPEDELRPVIEGLLSDGLLRASTSAKGDLLLSPAIDDADADVVPAEAVDLGDDDYRVLNALEDLEAGRIDAGVVEVWSDATDVVGRGWALDEVSAALTRLAAAGYVMLAADGRVRSRMAELAREVRHVKQRFRPDDASRRPYLVRSLKVLVRDRIKPRQDVPLQRVLDDCKARFADAEVHRSLEGLGAALSSMWGSSPCLAGFQARSFGAILSSWLGASPEDAFVVAADTGSGKTEAAALPIIAGACVDALRGLGGTRAVFAYPRVRLAANQSQRLARYLSALSRKPGMPTLTLGVQFADVPSSWRLGGKELEQAERAGWAQAGDVWRFPLFACPVPACGSPLELQPGRGIDGADRLWCASCSWQFQGWIGTKQGLRERPPALFLPTMDSLHQWMQTPRNGSLFGDGAASAPRAILADEIHLYAYVHGAQVGYAIRRFLARAEWNEPPNRKCLAIGMSATLGDPADAFGRLVGRSRVTLVRPEAGETPVNPRGREYFYFIQPEVESRDRDVAGASTTIQGLMCLAHGMRRRRGQGTGFRAITFLDSIDKVRRLHSAYDDAEGHNNLAALRTTRFDDDPITGRPRRSCCGEPATCERFVDGECWYFAANDRQQARADGRPCRPGRPLAVARSPISSGAEGVIERIIKDSDIVFATSSLEVGYDDPDIGLVLQHYGPQNLASFIQRKGRGGRGADDRPITAVTLSIYKPRDAYWFNRPSLMLDAKGFEAPLNPDNHFVRRAQILSQFLDGLAAFEAKKGLSPWRHDGRFLPEAADEAAALVETVFGPEPWKAYGFPDMAGLWSAALEASGNQKAVLSAKEARDFMPWIPQYLHDTVDLPSLEVIGPQEGRAAETDIQLAFAMLAPGNVTRRFDHLAGGWRPPKAGQAPWLADDDYSDAEAFEPCGPDPEALAAELPLAVRAALGPEVGSVVLKPNRLTLVRAGSFSKRWLEWEAAFCLGEDGSVEPIAGPTAPASHVDHESTGRLDGCTIVRIDADAGWAHLPPLGVAQIQEIKVYKAGRASGSGLSMSHVFWGSEAVLKTKAPGAEPHLMQQTFTDPRTGKVALHGYRVEAEGMQVILDEAKVSSFVSREVADPVDGMVLWQRLHMARAEAIIRLQATGLNRFDAERIAMLVGSMAVLPPFRDRVVKMKSFPSVDAICDTFEEVRREHQAFDPLLSVNRVLKAAQAVRDGSLGKVIRDVLRSLDDVALKERYVRSCLMHGLALRWRQLFVTLAQGDERRVSLHCKLPLLFGDATPVVTVAEAGQSGDGTTRAFQERIGEAWALWAGGFASSCPNADEDALVDRFFADRHRHAEWLAINPRDGRALERLGADLRADCTGAPAAVTRILFGHLVVGQEQFGTYEVMLAIRELRDALEAGLGRPSLGWELVSDVAGKAAAGAGPTPLVRLFQAYGQVPDADGEGSLSAPSRFGEQVYRFGTRLCTDGCRACVHQDGGILQGMIGEATVSRGLVGRYLTRE